MRVCVWWGARAELHLTPISGHQLAARRLSPLGCLLQLISFNIPTHSKKMSDISLVGESQCRVSSVLGRNTRELGKQHLFDGSAETCWNSDQGVPQWVALRWSSPVQVTTIIAQFQGGFCGAANTVVEVPQGEGSNEWHTAHSWPLEDVGTPQTLHLPEPLTTTSLRLTFPSSTDFFGRIIMYKLDVLGKKL
uniref:F5/8 type C domain-containing protein n=2 Tax=Scylla olivacea TaxID=85551 RepID=A0A0P4W3H7_SCYOL